MNPEHLMIMEEDGVLPPVPTFEAWNIWGDCLSWPMMSQTFSSIFFHLFHWESR